MALYNDPALLYETILQISLFILMPDRSELITRLLGQNAGTLVKIISPFDPESKQVEEIEDFQQLKTKMINKLNEIKI